MRRPILKRSDNIIDTKLPTVEGLSHQDQMRNTTTSSEMVSSGQYYGTKTKVSLTTFEPPMVTSIKDETTQIKQADNVTTMASMANPSMQKVLTNQGMAHNRFTDNADSSSSKINENAINRDNSEIENLGSNIEFALLESNSDEVNLPKMVDIASSITNDTRNESSYQEDNESQEDQEDEVILSWEEQKRRKEEEKQRLQQEAWEKEQRELELLQQQQQEDERKAKELKAKEAMEKEKNLEQDQKFNQINDNRVNQEQTVNEDPIMTGVDPIMQHYMELVKKRKEESKVVSMNLM